MTVTASVDSSPGFSARFGMTKSLDGQCTDHTNPCYSESSRRLGEESAFARSINLKAQAALLHRKNYPERLKLPKRKRLRLRTLAVSDHGSAVGGNANQRIQRHPRVGGVNASRVQHRLHILHSPAGRPNEAVIRVAFARCKRAAHDH